MIQCGQRQVFKNLGLKSSSPAAASPQDQATCPMISNSTYREAGQGTRATPTHYDQFLISCSDDGSINIYDVSSFRKSSANEFYTCDEHQTLFVPHTKGSFGQSDDESIMAGLKDLLAKNDTDQGEQIPRRTRKRQLGTGGNTNQTTANSSSQSQNVCDASSLFMIKLRSADFRAGTRNKHIDAFSVSPLGFLAGGTNHGEILLWKINFGNIRQHKQSDAHQWINGFRVHKKGDPFLMFNPAGDILMTGSADGVAALWDTKFAARQPAKASAAEGEEEKYAQGVTFKTDHTVPLKDINIDEDSLLYRFEEENTPGKLECQIDYIAWSSKGRYAFCATSVKQIAEAAEDGGEDGAKK